MTDPSPARRIRNACDSIHDALALAEHPPAPRGGQSGATSGSRPPMPVPILDAKLDLKQKITSWALMIGEDGGFVIDCDDETEARTTLAVLTAAWKAGGYVDVELHRQVAGIHEYLTGRARGIQPVMSFVADGVIPGICTFRGLDPEIMVASS